MVLRRPRFPRKYLYVVGVLALFIAFVLFRTSDSRRAPEACADGCNVILIAVDTLGAEHLKSYGYDRDTMPKVESFFEDAYRFENAHTLSPWTEPSFATLFFSDRPSRISYADLEGETRTTLMSVLREAGYAVRGVLLPETVFIYDAIATLFREDEQRFVESAFYTSGRRTPYAESYEAGRVLRTLESDWRATNKPFFLFIHSFGPHAPYGSGPENQKLFAASDGSRLITAEHITERNRFKDATDETRFLYRLRYDQKIREVDDALAPFLSSIPEDVLARTVVILTADHGEAFGEHGKFGHHQALHEEELHVPLFIRIPGEKGGAVAQSVSLLDIAPTVLSLAGQSSPSGFVGRDLSRMRPGTRVPFRIVPIEDGEPFFMASLPRPLEREAMRSLEQVGAAGSERPIIDLRENGLLVWPWKFFTDKDTAHAFNIKNDPGELHDLLEDSSSLGVLDKVRFALFKLTARILGYSLAPGALEEGELEYNIQG